MMKFDGWSDGKMGEENNREREREVKRATHNTFSSPRDMEKV